MSIENIIKTMRLTKMLSKILLPTKLRQYSKVFLLKDINLVIDGKSRIHHSQNNMNTLLDEKNAEDLIKKEKENRIIKAFGKKILSKYNVNYNKDFKSKTPEGEVSPNDLTQVELVRSKRNTK